MALKKSNERWLKKHAPGRLEGKTYLITGGNSGIGFHTARVYLSRGAKVILACRNQGRAEKAKETLLAEFEGASVHILILDLASFASIDSFCETFKNNVTDIDGIILNAGIARIKGKTADGLEVVMGTNYIGTRRLYEGLAEHLRSIPHPVEVFFTTSLCHHFATLKNSLSEQKGWKLSNYANTKVAINAYVRNLAEKEDSNLRLYLIHPGVTITPFVKKGFAKILYYAALGLRFLFNSTEKSALAAPYLSLAGGENGQVYGPNGLFWAWGFPKRNRPSHRVEKLRPRIDAMTEDFLK